MALPAIQTAFVAGEVSPSLFGHVDLARMHAAASTFRNGYVGFRGGFYSRAGTKFVGFSKQTGRAFPPRLIPFQFNIDQGLALEFGNAYMRVISDGAFVTESPFAITNITQANPAVVTVSALQSGLTASANNGAVSSSYAPGDTVALAGGTFTTRASLLVGTTTLTSLALNSPGNAGVQAPYAPGDTVTLAGGTQTLAPVIQVTTTKVLGAVIVGGGASLGNGVQTAVGTTGTGTRVQLNVTVAGGTVTTINSITNVGAYTANPANVLSETMVVPLTAGGTLPTFRLQMGILTFSVQSAGAFTANAVGGNFTQGSTSGSGLGATFQSGVFGPLALSFANAGAYTVVPGNPVAQFSTTGTGAGATFNATWTQPATLSNDDWMFLSGVGGTTDVNGETYVATNVAGNAFQLYNVYGAPIDSTAFGAYTSGGSAARIYTLATPYAEEDLPYLKYTQSADVMSLACVNQITQAEYPPQDLSRLSDANWQITPLVTQSGVSPPTTVAGAASSAGTVDYAYEVTSVNPADGSESVASSRAAVNSAVNIANTAGTITISWTRVAGVNEYNIYKATPGEGVVPPVGSLFGYVGTSLGVQFIDSNIVADFAQVPPKARNPFARGQIIGVTPVPGSGYTNATLAITSVTGSGAVLTAVIVSGGVVAWIVESPGQNYQPTDTMTVSGDGTGAGGTLRVGAETGTYPGCVTYFQQRRAYGYTLNNPDTYFMSQPGAYTNFDSRIPTISTDAIIGTPWGTQVNGIQHMVPTAAGLLVFTGLQNWLLVGAGSFATNVAPISPADQTALPQPEIGCSPFLPPVKINYDVLFVDSNSEFYYDQPYQGLALGEPIDITQNSQHLFVGYTFASHAWCRQPNKVLWAVRSDGIMLSLTWVKQQEVVGWGRHDTQGSFVSNCSVIEPPVDAQYLATQRYVPGHVAYMIERMDDRIWADVEDCWCVDAALSLPQPEPAATLISFSATGLGAITGVTGLIGGADYSSFTTATVEDRATQPNGKPGPGSGALPVLTIVGGAIAAVTFAPGSDGAGYVNPALVFSDPTSAGSGASAAAVLDNSTHLAVSPAVFVPGDVGSVLRMGGGIAQITAVTDSSNVIANMLSPIIDIIPNTGVVPFPFPSGTWTMTAPVTTISGLNHLIGATVTGLADGNVIPPQVVNAQGRITLAIPASDVTVGLGFTARLQSVYLDTGAPTVQGQRKKIAEVTARIEASLGGQMGSNQPDGSTQSPIQIAPEWAGLADLPLDGPNYPVKPYNAPATPLRTGDVRIPVSGGYATPGQVAIEQSQPLPLNVLAFIGEQLPGDSAQNRWPKRGTGQGGRGSNEDQ